MLRRADASRAPRPVKKEKQGACHVDLSRSLPLSSAGERIQKMEISRLSKFKRMCGTRTSSRIGLQSLNTVENVPLHLHVSVALRNATMRLTPHVEVTSRVEREKRKEPSSGARSCSTLSPAQPTLPLAAPRLFVPRAAKRKQRQACQAVFKMLELLPWGSIVVVWSDRHVFRPLLSIISSVDYNKHL